MKEGTTTSEKYEGKSVAEQNSIDLAWGLLMDPEYKDLQTAIYANENEFRRFRQLVVNSVIATDIFDKVRLGHGLAVACNDVKVPALTKPFCRI